MLIHIISTTSVPAKYSLANVGLVIRERLFLAIVGNQTNTNSSWLLTRIPSKRVALRHDFSSSCFGTWNKQFFFLKSQPFHQPHALKHPFQHSSVILCFRDEVNSTDSRIKWSYRLNQLASNRLLMKLLKCFKACCWRYGLQRKAYFKR